MKYKFELDVGHSDLLHQIINNERIKYLTFITKCIVSPDHKHMGLYTVEYCVRRIRRIDELEARMLGESVVQYTHDEQALNDLKPYYTNGE